MINDELSIALEYAIMPRRAGEYELKRYLRDKGHKVLDVTDNPSYWKKDIDFIVDGVETVEVKWDNRLADTGNLFIETYSDIHQRKEGWYKFCEAEMLYYGDAQNKVFFIFNFEELKAHIEAHKVEYKTATAADYDKDGIKKWSEGYLVPMDTLSGLYDTLDVWGY